MDNIQRFLAALFVVKEQIAEAIDNIIASAAEANQEVPQQAVEAVGEENLAEEEVLEVDEEFDGDEDLESDEEQDRMYFNYHGDHERDAFETLRKYPPVPFLTRKCVKDYKMCETTIEKGVVVLISTLGLHHDPDYFPHPETFDPERFSEENKHKITPFTYLPFGEGPRNCPAYRFGLMQIKVGLIVLLQHFIFSLNETTKVPVELESGSFTLKPKSPILLDIKYRNVHK